MRLSHSFARVIGTEEGMSDAQTFSGPNDSAAAH